MEQKNQSKVLSIIAQLSIKKGKKQVLVLEILKSLSFLKECEKVHPILILSKFVNKIKPFCEIKTLRIAHRFYKVPVTVNLQKQIATSFIWLFNNSKERQESVFSKRLLNELLETVKTNNSRTSKISKELHYVSQLNKMYIKYK
jgi:ribosomal protein S7